MHGLLLDSSLSDRFSSGRTEQFVPKDPDLEARIIRFRTSLRDIDTAELDAFFRNYDNLQSNSDRAIRIIEEFFLERFFEAARIRGNFGYVGYVEGDPGSTRETTNYVYEFFDNGRAIRVYDHDHRAVTEISRLVEIRKDNKRQFVLCVPVSRDYQTKFCARIKAAKDLVGREYPLSNMIVYAHDIFMKAVSPKQSHCSHRANSMYTSDIFFYLHRSPTNLVLVYSGLTLNFTRIGQEVLARIRDRQD